MIANTIPALFTRRRALNFLFNKFRKITLGFLIHKEKNTWLNM
jgi:hypothetical protein